MNTKITITGSTVCPACQMSGHDGDSCRANQLSDGRILCVTCGSYVEPFDAHAFPVSQMPYPVRCVVAVMLRNDYLHAPTLKLKAASFGPSSTSDTAAACAQGNEGVLLNGGSLAFTADSHGLARLQFRFQADELQDLPQNFGHKTRSLTEDEERFLHNLRLHSCPQALETAIGKLIAIGFSVRHTDFGGASMRRIVLHAGGTHANTEVPKGIMVEATYLV